MKSKDVQKLVLSKRENGDTTTEIFHDLNGSINLRRIQRWCKSSTNKPLSIYHICLLEQSKISSKSHGTVGSMFERHYTTGDFG